VAGSSRKAQEVDRNPPEKNPENFRPEYCFHVPAISGVFLQDHEGSGGRNHRPWLYCLLWLCTYRIRDDTNKIVEQRKNLTKITDDTTINIYFILIFCNPHAI